MAPTETIKIEKKVLLIVEGREDALFFASLAGHLGIEHLLQILPIGGKTQLRSNLRALVLTPGFSEVKCLGVVRDADSDPSTAVWAVFFMKIKSQQSTIRYR